MGFLKRLRKRLAKLKWLSKTKRKSTSECCECETLKEEICELNQQLGNMQKRYQELDLAERQLELLVTELKQNLVPTAKSSNLFKQLSELCDSISPCIITPQYFSQLEEEPTSPTDFDGESCCQQEFDALITELSDVNEVKQTSGEEQLYSCHEEQVNEVHVDHENDSGCQQNSAMHEDEVCEAYHEQSSEPGQLSCSNSAIEFYENLYTYQDQQKIQNKKDLHFSEEEEHLLLDNSESLKNNPIPTSDKFCQNLYEHKQETTQEGKTPEDEMERARLAFESIPELHEHDAVKLGLAVLEKYPLILPSTQPSNVEPPWSVPAPKPPSLFPNIERCWLDEEINYDDPIEVYMRQQATSWTAPKCGGPTSAMIQAGRMERNPPPDFIVEELDQ